MLTTITIGWTKSRVVDGQLLYSSFSGYEHGEQQHTESITVDVPQDTIDDTRYDWREAVADAVFEATNAPKTWTWNTLALKVGDQIDATGYRGHGAHYSLSTGDTVTIGNVMLECAPVGWKRRLTRLDYFLFTQFLTGPTHVGMDNRRNALAIRMGRELGCEDDVLALIKDGRRHYLTRQILLQRKWQTSTSRRPQRGRNHDSWAIREHYVRCDEADYIKHLGYGHVVRADHGIDDSPYNRKTVA